MGKELNKQDVSNSRKYNAKRKDRNRAVLKTGESQRADGRYVYRWTDRKGKRNTVYAKTLKQLRDKEADIQRDILDGIRTMENCTVNDMFELWCRIKRGLKDNTFQNYKYMYNTYIRDDIGRLPISRVKKSKVKEFYNKLVDADLLRVNTLDTLQNILHQVMDIAVDDGYLRFNPTDKALTELKRANNSDKKRRKALTKEEQDVFLEYVKNHKVYAHWYPLFAFMIGTGMRIGEVVGLRWCDVDMKNDLIDVNHTLVYYDHGEGHCAYEVNTTKTEAGERTIPMLKMVREALAEERKNQMKNGIRCQASIAGYTDFIFLNRFGNLLNNGIINKAICRIVRDYNEEQLNKEEEEQGILLPRFSCHTLRHTFTTRMIEAGVNVKVVQETLGHTDVSTTLNIYADATDEFKKQEFKNLDQHFQNAI